MADISRTFDIEDQRWFASVSGDSNPLHVDAQWAASHFPGALVVHGQHLLLWALDRLAETRPNDHFTSIEATYLKPVVVGDRVEAALAEAGTVIRATVRHEIVMVARVRPGESRGSGDWRLRGGVPLATPRVRSVADFAGLTGTVTLPNSASEIAVRFRALASLIGADRVIGLAAVSTLVGMDCPGLRSLLSRVSVTIADASGAGDLAFRVREFHEAMSLVEIDFSGLGIAGTVLAFTGTEPAAPPSDEAIRALVSATEFKGQRPLIVGASSGLGAATARLLAAGGADPTLTWHISKVDETVKAIQAFGAAGQNVNLDAAAPSQGLANLAAAGWRGEQIYYFATPRIFRRRLEPYQKHDFRDFASVFVDGFYEMVRGLTSTRPRPLTIFYPSSVVVDEPTPDLLEYALAKTMGESVCARLQKKISGLKIVVTRLPRIATRQTETFLKVKSNTPEATMLPIIRAVQSTRAGSP
jgi:acyl dehydratase/NAD(P)-dependent dehydrogenase (short-subunit alcohol dehydrogenase family)